MENWWRYGQMKFVTTWQQIEAQHMSWGQGCSPLLLSTPFYSGVILLLLCMVLDKWDLPKSRIMPVQIFLDKGGLTFFVQKILWLGLSCLKLKVLQTLSWSQLSFASWWFCEVFISCSIYNDSFSTHDCYSTKTQMCKTQYPGCYDLAKWLSYYLYFFSFLF